MIDVEETALRAFEQNAFIRVREIVEYLRNVRRDWRHDLGVAQRFVQRFCKVDRLGAEIILQQEVMVVENLTQLGRENLAHKDVGDLQRAACDFVLVSRPDTAAGRADGAANRALSRVLHRARRVTAESTGSPG